MTDSRAPWRQTPTYHRAGRPLLVRQFASWLFHRMGWKIEGEIPRERRLILAVGPHTSNWDFVVAVLAMLALDIRLHFLAKHSLFRQPLGWVMTALGGIPIDRSKPQGFTEETAARIRQSENLLLAITPEGTRSRVAKLKTGFSRIARSVPCPLMPVLFDFRNRTVQLLESRLPGESPEQDGEDFRALYNTVQGKIPENF